MSFKISIPKLSWKFKHLKLQPHRSGDKELISGSGSYHFFHEENKQVLNDILISAGNPFQVPSMILLHSDTRSIGNPCYLNQMKFDNMGQTTSTNETQISSQQQIFPQSIYFIVSDDSSISLLLFYPDIQTLTLWQLDTPVCMIRCWSALYLSPYGDVVLGQHWFR